MEDGWRMAVGQEVLTVVWVVLEQRREKEEREGEGGHVSMRRMGLGLSCEREKQRGSRWV